MKLTNLEKRVLEISYKHKLSHLNGCLTAGILIDNIYKVKKPEDIFVLSAGHTAVALYVVLEKIYGFDAEKLFLKHGVHPNRDLEDKIYCSSGSLGSGITIAVGMAMANRERDVYVLMGDGEFAEGSCWEALRIAGELRLENLKVMVNANGTSAYGKVDVDLLDMRLQMFFPTLVVKTNLYRYPSWLQSWPGHYVVLDKQKYEELIKE
jgi:transketolase